MLVQHLVRKWICSPILRVASTSQLDRTSCAMIPSKRCDTPITKAFRTRFAAREIYPESGDGQDSTVKVGWPWAFWAVICGRVQKIEKISFKSSMLQIVNFITIISQLGFSAEVRSFGIRKSSNDDPTFKLVIFFPIYPVPDLYFECWWLPGKNWHISSKGTILKGNFIFQPYIFMFFFPIFQGCILSHSGNFHMSFISPSLFLAGREEKTQTIMRVGLPVVQWSKFQLRIIDRVWSSTQLKRLWGFIMVYILIIKWMLFINSGTHFDILQLDTTCKTSDAGTRRGWTCELLVLQWACGLDQSSCRTHQMRTKLGVFCDACEVIGV